MIYVKIDVNALIWWKAEEFTENSRWLSEKTKLISSRKKNSFVLNPTESKMIENWQNNTKMPETWRMLQENSWEKN